MKAKRSFTSLDIAVIIEEFNRFLTDSYIDNIYIGNLDEFIFKITLRDGSTKFIVIEPARRAHFTRYITRYSSKGRVMLFRRFIRNSKIVAIKQVDFERILTFELIKRGINYLLIAELIPRGILTVVDSSSYRTLVTSHDFHGKDRLVKPGTTYKYPPMYGDFRKMTTAEWLANLSKGKDLARGLIRGLGIPPEVVNEVLADEEKRLKPDEIDEGIIEEIKTRILRFINDTISNPTPTIVVDSNGDYISFHPFKPRTVCEGCKVLHFNSFSEAVDEFYRQVTAETYTAEGVATFENEKQKIIRTLERARKELGLAIKQRDMVSRVLDVVSRNYYIIDETLRCVKSTIKTSGWQYVSKCGVQESQPSKGVIKLVIDGLELLLDVREDLNTQYVKLKKKFNNLEKKIIKATEVIKDLEKKLEKLDTEIKRKEKLKPLARKIEWYSKYHWIITSHGFLSVGGRDAQQNEKVVKRYLEDNDLFMHAEVHGGSAFVIKASGKIPPEEDLREVATLAASYSKGWKAGVGSLDVYWVWGKQVSKSPPAGEYLPKGAFMVYGKKNYIKGVELRLAIGVLLKEGHYEVITGPPNYVSARTKLYVVIVPGNRKPHVLGKFVRDFFIKVENRLTSLTYDEIIQRIPGDSDIIELSPKR